MSDRGICSCGRPAISECGHDQWVAICGFPTCGEHGRGGQLPDGLLCERHGHPSPDAAAVTPEALAPTPDSGSAGSLLPSEATERLRSHSQRCLDRNSGPESVAFYRDVMAVLDALAAVSSPVQATDRAALEAARCLTEVANDFLNTEYPNGTGRPADAEAARLSRATAECGAALNATAVPFAAVSVPPEAAELLRKALDIDGNSEFPHSLTDEIERFLLGWGDKA